MNADNLNQHMPPQIQTSNPTYIANAKDTSTTVFKTPKKYPSEIKPKQTSYVVPVGNIHTASKLSSKTTSNRWKDAAAKSKQRNKPSDRATCSTTVCPTTVSSSITKGGIPPDNQAVKSATRRWKTRSGMTNTNPTTTTTTVPLECVLPAMNGRDPDSSNCASTSGGRDRVVKSAAKRWKTRTGVSNMPTATLIPLEQALPRKGARCSDSSTATSTLGGTVLAKSAAKRWKNRANVSKGAGCQESPSGSGTSPRTSDRAEKKPLCSNGKRVVKSTAAVRTSRHKVLDSREAKAYMHMLENLGKYTAPSQRPKRW